MRCLSLPHINYAWLCKDDLLDRALLRKRAGGNFELTFEQWLESFVAADKTFCVYLAKTRLSSVGTPN
jgi:hypothetical protein